MNAVDHINAILHSNHIKNLASTYLIIIGQRLGQRVVNDVAHIRFVDTHTKRDRRTYDFDVTCYIMCDYIKQLLVSDHDYKL